MTVDPVPALRSLGYTEREAAFLYLVAVHSGYFLRRQFDWFIDRNRGAIAHHFVNKTRSLGHVEAKDCGDSRFVYHLFAKPIYRLIGNADSQHRRWKADGAVRARLMTLDYVLQNEDAHFITSSVEKMWFLAEVRHVPRKFFTDGNGRLLPLLTNAAISIANRNDPASSRVKFLFADEALLSESRFRRFLSSCDRLVRMLHNFEIIYATTSEHGLAMAREEFWSRFGNTPRPPRQATLGADWRGPEATATMRHAPVDAYFTTILFRYNYPRIRRKEVPSLSTVRQAGLSGSRQDMEIERDSTEPGSKAG